jgi:hypothetical protein
MKTSVSINRPDTKVTKMGVALVTADILPPKDNTQPLRRRSGPPP